ncbi:MAG: hypothetical protein WC690_10090, partial [bacterium]
MEQWPVLAESAISSPAVQLPNPESAEESSSVQEEALPASNVREADSYTQAELPAMTILSRLPSESGVRAILFYREWKDMEGVLLGTLRAG